VNHGVLDFWILYALINNPGWVIKRTHFYLILSFLKIQIKMCYRAHNIQKSKKPMVHWARAYGNLKISNLDRFLYQEFTN
jgi:hypothetical protein